MSREIRFRAWDKKWRVMFGNDMMLKSGRELVTFAKRHSPITEIQNAHGGLLLPTDDENMVFMQYTGLKDKNGVEIYEGDVVRFMYNSKPPAEYVGEVKWDERDLAWTFARMLIEPTPRKTIEVIGNIYQHPDLLKEASTDV